MSRLPDVTGAELVNALRKAGFVVSRGLIGGRSSRDAGRPLARRTKASRERRPPFQPVTSFGKRSNRQGTQPASRVLTCRTSTAEAGGWPALPLCQKGGSTGGRPSHSGRKTR